MLVNKKIVSYTADDPVTIFDYFNYECDKPRETKLVSDFGYFKVLHPSRCTLHLEPLLPADKVSAWNLRCWACHDDLLFADYTEYHLDWAFVIHSRAIWWFKRYLDQRGWVIPTTWYLDEWLGYRYPSYIRIFNKKPMFVLVR